MATENLLGPHGLDPLVADAEFGRDATGLLFDPWGARVVLASAETMRGLHHVVEAERPGAWRSLMKAIGHGCGARIAVMLDARLVAMAKPALGQLPLEVSLALLEHRFALHGWGRLEVDLTDASAHGLVLAKVQHSYFVEALPAVPDFVDALLAGMLQGFFEHISGQSLACEEIGCGRRGAPACTFVVAPADRLTPMLMHIGRETPEAVLARLRT